MSSTDLANADNIPKNKWDRVQLSKFLGLEVGRRALKIIYPSLPSRALKNMYLIV